MPIYEITKDKLEEILEECIKKGNMKPSDVELVHEITEAVDKLDKIIERKNNGEESYGEYGRNQRRDSRGRYKEGGNESGGSYGRYSNGGYGNYGNYGENSRSGNYQGRGGYGHDKGELISGIEEKMAHVTGEEQEALRRAVRILERG